MALNINKITHIGNAYPTRAIEIMIGDTIIVSGQAVEVIEIDSLEEDESGDEYRAIMFRYIGGMIDSIVFDGDERLLCVQL